MDNLIIKKLKETETDFVDIRHQIHEYPEIGFEEKNTGDLVASKLKEWGYTVTRGLAGTGVVGTLKVGNSPKVIGIRADMDALPMQEKTGKPWSSKLDNRFHGCGHDGHTTILLCAAKYLAETKNFDGTLNLIFQPAEELLYGGSKMMQDGLFNKFPCDVLFAMHNMPGMKTGEFYFRHGEMMASSDTIEIEVDGVGAHGAMPDLGIDATLVSCYIAIALQSIVSRNISPQSAAVVTIGAIQSGEAPNIINDKALMKLTVRCLSNDVRKKVLERITSIAQEQARSFGATVKINHINGSPVLVNGTEATDFAIKVAADLFGNEKVHTQTPALMSSEDFAFMLEAHPNGCYMLIGGGDDAGRCMVHNPGYDFNDQSIVSGATMWVGITETYLKK